MSFWVLILCLVMALSFASHPARAEDMLAPVIDGEWWQVAGDPDLGEYTREKQQPVDFAVWQAADGTWQLWSCIRGTGCGGHNRVFHRWEGQHLTDSNWEPMGIAMEAKPEFGETQGGLQAPHVERHEGLYYMAYGDWVNICFATSKDGKTFQRRVRPSGKTGVFSEGPLFNTRDPMLIRINGLWHCYYTAYPQGRGYTFCRTSPDLETWSPSSVVSYGGQLGPGPTDNECPHVVEVEPGLFYFFRNQYYGEDALNWVYRSGNPLNFGIDDDTHLVRSWHLAAPEIIHHEGQYYIAALLDSLKGIKIARMKWVKVPEFGPPVFDFDSPEARDAWVVRQGNLPAAFTNSSRTHFLPKTEYFIGTAELEGRKFDVTMKGIIESPPFTLNHRSYILLVSGGRQAETIYVALVDADNGKELVRVTGNDGIVLSKVLVDCSKHLGKKALLRVVDNAVGPWGFINFGGLYVDPTGAHGD